MVATLAVSALGPTPYPRGLAFQEAAVKARAADATSDWLVFPDHPPVLTVGRGARDGSIVASRERLASLGIETYEVARGGDVTWHGAGQLVGYTIVHLDRVGRDLHRFLRGLEAVLIESLGSFGIAAGVSPGRTGVWVGDDKIASIGVGVRRWVSFHGFALNVAPDLTFFDLIHPCGLRGIHMTSMARLLGDAAPPLAEVRTRTTDIFARRFGYAGVRWADAWEESRTW